MYNEIKDFIIDELGSDLCFVQWSLLKAFFKGLKNSPSPEQENIELKFLRQNIQLNIGCTINYNRLKARRLPHEIPREPPVQVDRSFKLPLLLEDWDLLSEKSKAFWKQAMIEKGILEAPHPLTSTRAPEKRKSFFDLLHSIVHHLLDKVRGLVKRSKS